MEIRIVTRSEFHKTALFDRFMELRGDRRTNKPILGLFSRHYISTGGKTFPPPSCGGDTVILSGKSLFRHRKTATPPEHGGVADL